MTSPSRFAGVAPALLWLAAAACGENAEGRYAGLEAWTVPADNALGVGYVVRYRDPPWEPIENDALVLGKSNQGRIGADAELTPLEPGTAVVLEIERTSVLPDDPNVVTYPKYRLEAGVVRCAAGTLVGEDVCAEKLAAIENQALASTDDTGFYGATGREGHNDAEQRYFEILTRNRDSIRYRRLVYFETGVRDLAVRVALEANPSLSEVEVTRMVDAVEVLTTAPGVASGDAGTASDAGGE